MPTSSLILLLDADDLACAEALSPEALHSHRAGVLAFDLDIHIVLRERGVAHLTPWDLVHRRDRAEADELVAEAWRFWKSSARAMDSGVDVLSLAEYRHAACLLRLSWAALIIDRAIDRLRPREVVAFEEQAGHGLDQTHDYTKMPLAHAMVRGMAEQSGIPVRLLRRGDAPGSVAGFVDRVASNSAPDLPEVNVSDTLGGRPWILFQGNGADLLRQLPVIEALQASGARSGLTIAQVYKTADQSILRSLERAGHLLWHESQVTRETPPVERLPQTEAAIGAFRAAGQSVPPRLRGIFANRHLDIHYDFIFGEYARRMAWHARAWTHFLGRHRPLALVTSFPAAIFDIAGHLGIPAIMLPHALMVHGFANWARGFRGSLAAALGRPHARRLVDAGFAPDEVRVVGDPAIDALLRRTTQPDDNARYACRATLLKRMGRPATDPVILLPTTSISSPATMAMLPPVDWADAARRVDELAAMIARRPEWAFVVKCHPRYDHRAMYEAANRSLPPACRLLILSEEPLAELAPAADVIVIPNSMSSAVVEVSLWPRPVLILDTSLVWWDHRAWETHHWSRVDSVDGLESELARLLGEREAHAAEVARTKSAVAAFFGGEPEPAAGRCAAWIMDVAAKSSAAADHNAGCRPVIAGVA